MKPQKKVQAHVIYRNKEGKRLIGVSTIVGMLSKPNLLVWANNLGLEGLKMDAYTDDLASVGTLAHEMVNCHITGRPLDTNEYSKNDIDRAENAMISFLAWIKNKKIEPICSEKQFVSEKYQYGGTPDIYCYLNGEPTLIDVKTSKAIYDDHFIQLAGYKILLEENDLPVMQSYILRIGRDETEGFEVRSITNFEKWESLFHHLLEVYNLLRRKK